MDYALTTHLDLPFAEAVDRTRAALAEQGFGVLTEIDVRRTLHTKIGAELEDYLILGACNPPLAHRAIEADRRIGLLLPCNVVVRAGEGHTVVEAIDPQVMVGISEAPELAAVAEEAARLLRAALATLTEGAAK
ncbi:DUF302 domain-containing protein [Kitasatospora sp. NPDC002227]|uniref:DUF302 domain-containing protein n=1 Tax=Kitasatospora sp. NPDC002227 TaxID=3154773 RepID=UPI003325D374